MLTTIGDPDPGYLRLEQVVRSNDILEMCVCQSAWQKENEKHAVPSKR